MLHQYYAKNRIKVQLYCTALVYLLEINTLLIVTKQEYI